MTILDKNTKHNKHSEDFQKNLQWLSSVLAKDEQTKIKTLETELVQANENKEKVKKEIKKIEVEQANLGDIVGTQRRVNNQLTDLSNNYSGTGTKKKESFLSNATNKYDWETKIKTYFPTSYLNNLYEGTIGGSQTKITEQEAIKILTRVIKSFEKINQAKFGTKFTASTHTTGTNHLPVIQTLAKDGLKDNLIIGKDTNGSDLPDKGKPANHATLNQTEYSFKSQFVADADIQKNPSATPFTFQTTETITKVKVQDFFSFIDNISKDGTIKPEFLTELKADADILKDIENNTDYKLVPAQDNSLEPAKLADYGIKVSNDANTKLYLSETHDKAVKFTINEGLKSWIELVHAFFPSGSTQRVKLADSFSADPYQQLLTDIADNTHSAHWELPESLSDLQDIADQIELKKISASGQIVELGRKLTEKQEELKTKTAEFATQEQELTALLGKILTKKREALGKFEISKGFENKTDSGGEDNRRTESELFEIRDLLLQIRYLENDGDCTLESSVADENTALTKIEDIWSKSFSLWHSSSWDSIGWVKGTSEQENYNRPNSEKIKIIKERKDVFFTLTYYHDKLVELEKLVKLTDRQIKIKTDLKAAIDQKSPEENLQEWRDTLKVLDADLATAFTDEKIAKWKEEKDGKKAFDNTASIKSLLEKVCVKKADGSVEKINDDFISFLKGKDSKLESLSKLISEKSPEEVILIIHQWEFNKLEDSKKKERYLKFAWSDLGGKQKIDSKDKLEDSEKADFDKYLYQCAIGKINEALLAKPAEEQQDNDNKPPKNKEETPKGHFAQYWWAYTSLGVVAAVGVLVAIFWKQIKSWWAGPEEEKIEEPKEDEKDPQME
ncbi:MAG: hypothetical protein I3273_04215 [Candidatus Moeniiplasma glomeromycotorum]|nr:hypothetical protein [Candidatus Moeniiplasma glomeromycotorum]